MTHSTWSGWHHVEVHDDEWWRGRMESMGFVYSAYLTNMMRSKAAEDKKRTDLLKSMEEGKVYDVGQHMRLTLQVKKCPSKCKKLLDILFLIHIHLPILSFDPTGVHQPYGSIPPPACSFICRGKFMQRCKKCSLFHKLRPIQIFSLPTAWMFRGRHGFWVWKKGHKIWKSNIAARRL